MDSLNEDIWIGKNNSYILYTSFTQGCIFYLKINMFCAII